MNTKTNWQDDWLTFIQILEQKIQAGESNAELSEYFSSNKVRWTGKIEKIDFDELCATVDVMLPECSILLANGEKVVLDGLALAVAETDMTAWQYCNAGDEVSFEASLGKGDSPFPCVEVKMLGNGENIILIGLNNAIPILEP